jgi:hypothetical protein
MIVSAVAFGAGALCLYYGARDLRTRRAIRRLKGRRDARAERDVRTDASSGRRREMPSERTEIPSERTETLSERTGMPSGRTETPFARTDTSMDRPSGLGTSAPGADDQPEDPREDVAIERGFVLLALGGLCLLFGILAF